MTNELDVRALARRVIGRVLAERGRAELATAEPRVAGVSRPTGVHVVVEPGGAPARPAAPRSGAPMGSSSGLVTADDLRSTPDGGRFSVPRGTIVTELAREEAWRRRIALTEGPQAPEGARRSDARLRIAVGADHGGFELKQELAEWLREAGHVLLDHGTFDSNAVDYPDFARAVAEAVTEGRADVGICVDGAGIGSAMAANKVPGVRAANGYDVASAKNAREHNYANVLTLGGKRLTRSAAREIVEAFLKTPWGEERHARRIDKLDAIERQYSKAPAGQRPNERGRSR